MASSPLAQLAAVLVALVLALGIPGIGHAATCSASNTLYIPAYDGTPRSNSQYYQINCKFASAAGTYFICTASGQQSGTGGSTIDPYRQLDYSSKKINWQLNDYNGSTPLISAGIPLGTVFFQTSGSGSGNLGFNVHVPQNQAILNGEYATTLDVPVELRKDSCSGSVEASFNWTFALTVQIAVRCEVTGGSLSFGSGRTTTAVAVDAIAGITIVCNTPGLIPISIDNGLHASGTSRRLMRTNGPDTLNYNVYTDPGRTDEWSSGELVNIYANTNSPFTVYLYGRMPGQTTPNVGVYKDTIQLTVTY